MIEQEKEENWSFTSRKKEEEEEELQQYSCAT